MFPPAATMLPLVVLEDTAAYRPSGPPDPQHPLRVGSRDEILAEVSRLEARSRPRWVVLSAASGLVDLVSTRVPVQRVWDVAEAHRVWAGRWRADPAYVWSSLLDLPGPLPTVGTNLLELALELDSPGAPNPPGEEPAVGAHDEPVRADGHLRPDALIGWADRQERVAALVDWLADLVARQHEAILGVGPRALSTVHAESAAALLCLELERDGLPVDRGHAERLIAEQIGPRPRDEREADRMRRERDARVLAHAPGRHADLRNPAQVKALLAACGVDVPSTRKWHLDPYRTTHPIVAALLQWRAQERIGTTYGYRWLDEHVGQDGRLRGAWTACDAAAGRMTAQAGLHSLPAVLRPAVRAEPGHVLIRADLGQIEPRVLAAVSGDPAFAAATRSEDLYAPVAAALGVPRAQAKVAVLAAMYGQRSGAAGAALRDLQRSFPVAMGYLDAAYAAGLAGRSVRTFGGRLIRSGGDAEADPAARGRFVRNAVVQGAAAELFKAWAATVRPAVAGLGGQIVMCLHDELLVHVPAQHAQDAAAAVLDSLAGAARRWVGHEQVRFVADVRVLDRWR